MLSHSLNQSLPEFFAAFFMDRFVAYDRKLVGARRHKNEHGIALRRFVHSEPMKLFLRSDEWIYIQVSALNENTNLAGSFRFGLPDCGDDPIVLELAEKFFGSHRYQLEPAPPPPKLPPPPLNPLNPLNPPPPPEDDQPPPPPPNPIGIKVGPLRPDE